mmetsp:Transcript_14271/g.39249  ORF Transcript_14271/g.39249 Transcript_14271/m.39249 type:complete len:225 (-) Transcript_14271:279-953(-)
MKAEADFTAHLTIATSAVDQVEVAETRACRNLEGATGSGWWITSSVMTVACKNLCGATGLWMTSSTLESVKPLARMKLSSVLSPLFASWASDHGRFLLSDWSKDQESRSLLKTAPPATVLSGGASWCLDRTSMAAFRFSRACTLSLSMPWNSASCFSRNAVASARACLSEASWASNSLMLTLSSALLAVRLSMVEVSSSILAEEALMASPFSYLPLLHQQASSL